MVDCPCDVRMLTIHEGGSPIPLFVVADTFSQKSAVQRLNY